MNTNGIILATVVVIVLVLIAYFRGPVAAIAVAAAAAAAVVAAVAVAAVAAATNIKFADNPLPSSEENQIFGGGYKEEQIRTIFESLLGVSFPLDREALAPYELDGYNRSLKLAFEFQGPHHYVHLPLVGADGKSILPSKPSSIVWDPSKFSQITFTPAEAQLIEENAQTTSNSKGSYGRLLRALNTDKKKLEMAEQKGIKIIVIPYKVLNIYKDRPSLENYISSRLYDAGKHNKPNRYFRKVDPPPVDLTEYVIARNPEWDPLAYRTPTASRGLYSKDPDSFRYYDRKGNFYEPALVPKSENILKSRNIKLLRRTSNYRDVWWTEDPNYVWDDFHKQVNFIDKDRLVKMNPPRYRLEAVRH